MASVGVVLGLVVGLLLGGRLDNLLAVRLRWLPLILLAAACRFGFESMLAAGVQVPDLFRVLLFALTYGLLASALFRNRSLPGMAAASAGTIANGFVILLNSGRMPVWQPSLAAAGLDPTIVQSRVHTLLPAPLDGAFYSRGGPLADILPIPIPFAPSVASIGDVLLAGGLAFLAFAAVVRAPALTTPVSPARAAIEDARLRRILLHPYARLALNGQFSALWTAQLVSSLGDRVHQIALVFLVAAYTQSSPFAVGVAFAAATLPMVVVGPVAGAYVDRWDHRKVMIVSDLLRAAIVIAIPAAVILHVALVYPLIIALSIVSTFFRPARVAALARIVDDEDLMPANSAMWVGDTLSDIVGYPFAGLFVAFLGSALSLAFWVDGASYLVSAFLIASMTIPRPAGAGVAPRVSIRSDLAGGIAFLRKEAVLLVTTIQAAIAEFGFGALTALSPILFVLLTKSPTEAKTAYGYFETSIGLGAVAGGFVIGSAAARIRKGVAISGAFAVFGLALIALGYAAMDGSELTVPILIGGVLGVANVSFVVPSITLYQQRTPPDLMGRVSAIRFAVVNGVVALAMVTAGLLAQVFGVPAVLIACGGLTAIAGVGGFFVPAIRRA